MMPDVPILWVVCGAIALLVIAVAWRLLAGSFPDAKPLIPEASPLPSWSSADGPPYGVDRRPLPESESIDQLLPANVGAFQRTSVDVPDDLYRGSAYANYSAERSKVFVELGLSDTADGARRALARAKAETDAEFPEEPQSVSIDNDPAWLRTNNRQGAFMAWTRGRYYFSAHAQKGQAVLDEFMHAFPY
jgi:hypothetical protein